MYECMHCIYNFGQPWLILLASCTIVIYDNYNIIGIHETFFNNFFTIIILDLCVRTQLLVKIITIIISLSYN
jgi:hypothetical protein